MYIMKSETNRVEYKRQLTDDLEREAIALGKKVHIEFSDLSL